MTNPFVLFLGDQICPYLATHYAVCHPRFVKANKNLIAMQRLTQILTLLLILFLPAFVGCEGPAGPQGSEGPQGPVGPAGEDGSMMYSGSGGPDASIGEIGDYYIDTDTGELYGPKDDSGWGNPIIVLQGEDGEDGSQIHAGSGAPDASLGALGDFYLDKANYDMYGPKTESGWGTPVNLKGADGNANVTRYIFPGHDFATDSQFLGSFSNTSRQEMIQSAWIKYLVYEEESTNNILTYYDMPGYGKNGNSQYSADHYQSDFYENRSYVEIQLRDGAGESYDRVEVVRIEANNTEYQTKQKTGEIIPSGLDTSDYKAVAEYYGFYQ